MQQARAVNATTPHEELALMRLAAAHSGVDVDEFVLPRDQYVTLRGLRFHYLDWGTDGKPPVLFLHGGGLNAHTYDLVCLALRREVRCVALDQRGHGDTEWSESLEYGFEAYAADVDALVDHLGFARFALVGMSLGGLNALEYSRTHASKLAGLVLVDIGPNVRPEGRARVRAFMTEDAALPSIDDHVARAVGFNPRRDPRLLRRSLVHNLRQLPDGRWTWKWDRRRLNDTTTGRSAQRRADLWNNVPLVTCPALVVRGANSDVLSDDDADELVRRLPDGRRVTVPNAGHTVQGDNPAGLVVELRRFFREIGYVTTSQPLR